MVKLSVSIWISRRSNPSACFSRSDLSTPYTPSAIQQKRTTSVVRLNERSRSRSRSRSLSLERRSRSTFSRVKQGGDSHLFRSRAGFRDAESASRAPLALSYRAFAACFPPIRAFAAPIAGCALSSQHPSEIGFARLAPASMWFAARALRSLSPCIC